MKSNTSPITLCRNSGLEVPLEDQSPIQKLLIEVINKNANPEMTDPIMTYLPGLLTDLDDIIIRANKLRFEAVKIIHSMDE